MKTLKSAKKRTDYSALQPLFDNIDLYHHFVWAALSITNIYLGWRKSAHLKPFLNEEFLYFFSCVAQLIHQLYGLFDSIVVYKLLSFFVVKAACTFANPCFVKLEAVTS